MNNKTEKRIVYKIPVGNRKWWEFWKKTPKAEIKEMMKKYNEPVEINDEEEIWIPVSDK